MIASVRVKWPITGALKACAEALGERMRRVFTVACGLALACALGCGVQAQPASAPLPVTPQKLALAQQVVDASGGRRNSTAVLRLLNQQMETAFGSNMTSPEDKRFLSGLLQDELGKMLNKVLAGSADIYAETFTDKELSDLLDFYRSPTGQALSEKLPDVLRRTNALVAPLLPPLQRDMVDRIFDYMCQKQHCSPAQREQLDAIRDKALAQAAQRQSDAAIHH